MTVEIWRFEHSAHSHESAALLHLARELHALSDFFVMVTNPILEGRELDALVMKHNMVFVVEIKSAHGPVKGDFYGVWTTTLPDGSQAILNEGREENPFQQLQQAYKAAKNFLESNAAAVMTPSEAAINDFRKIKNVLIFDPEYDEENSEIELGKESWKITLTGLHNNVADPFFNLRHTSIYLTPEHMRAYARDVLHCHPYEDLQRLLDEEDYITNAAIPPEDTEPKLPILHIQPPSTEQDEDLSEDAPSRPPLSGLKTVLKQASQQIGKVGERLEEMREHQRATHKIDFETLVYELRKAADSSIHHLVPETFVANSYLVKLDAYSYAHIKQLLERYQARAAEELQAYIREREYTLEAKYKRLAVHIECDETLTSQIVVEAEYAPIPPAVLLTGEHTIERAVYPGERIRIGRGQNADYPVPDDPEHPVVSREHCILSVSPSGVATLHDHKSTNGTFVNGKPIRSVELADGDIILLGRNKKGMEGPLLHVTLPKS